MKKEIKYRIHQPLGFCFVGAVLGAMGAMIVHYYGGPEWACYMIYVITALVVFSMAPVEKVD